MNTRAGRPESPKTPRRRVIENFVTNALRHTPAGSPLRISIAGGEGGVRVAVPDQGTADRLVARVRHFENFRPVEHGVEAAYHAVAEHAANAKASRLIMPQPYQR